MKKLAVCISNDKDYKNFDIDQLTQYNYCKKLYGYFRFYKDGYNRGIKLLKKYNGGE